MSLPSSAVFTKDGKVVSIRFINCGWVYEGDLPTLHMVRDLYGDLWNEGPVPEDYDRVTIYEANITKEEFDYIVEKSIEAGRLKKRTP